MPEVPFFFSDMLHLGPIIIYSRGVGVGGLVEFRFILKIVPPPPLEKQTIFQDPPPHFTWIFQSSIPRPPLIPTHTKKKKKKEREYVLPTYSFENWRVGAQQTMIFLRMA